MSHTKKLALITGASKGIGLELARVFAKNDFDLIIASNSEKLQSAGRILRQYEVDVTEIQTDLASQEGVDLLCDKVNSLGRPIDVAVLNAGVGVGGEFTNIEFEKEKNMMNLNMVYLVYLAKKVLQNMVKRDEGKILITSSIAAEMPGPYYAVYAATKAFLQSFTEGLRFELKEVSKNITITSLQPGATDTEFFKRAEMENTKAGQGEKDDPAKVAEQGFEALMRGDDHVVAGSFKNKVQAVASKFMSEKQGARAQASSTRPDSLSH